MALSGNLREFELPDIFQLIGQQKKTGKLVLKEGDREAWVAFSQGSIVAAATDKDSILDFLTRYLINIKQYPVPKISEFIGFCKGGLSAFADITLKIQYLTPDELRLITHNGVEDLACSLFAWKTGSYRFDAMPGVIDVSIGDVSFSTDAITMEAMRRVDELKRIYELIDPKGVYLPADPSTHAALAREVPVNFVYDSTKYILLLLDGIRTVEDLFSISFISRYRILETLFTLIQTGQVVQLSTEAAAQARKSVRNTEPSGLSPAAHLSISALVTAGIMLVIFLTGYYLVPRVILSVRTSQTEKIVSEAQWANAERMVRAATVQYHAVKGTPPKSVLDLKEAGFLTDRDVGEYLRLGRIQKGK